MVIGSRIRIPDHFSTSLAIAEGILRDLLAFLIPVDFHDTRRTGVMTAADKLTNPQHFRSDPETSRFQD